MAFVPTQQHCGCLPVHLHWERDAWECILHVRKKSNLKVLKEKRITANVSSQ